MIGIIGSSIKRRRIPRTWTMNTDHSFEAGASSLLWRVRYGSDGYWVIVGRKNTNTAGMINYTTDPTGTWSEPTTLGYGNGEMARTISFDGTNWGTSGYSKNFVYKATPPSGNWTSADWTGTTTNAYGGDYGNGYWAMGGDAPAIVYKSSIAGSYSTATEPFTVQINCIQYGADGYWVAGGTNNEIATASSTPVTFTARTSPMDAGSTITNAAHGYKPDGTSIWVIVGTTGQLGYATDPTSTWTVVDEPGPFTTSDTIRGVGYGNGCWVIGGDAGKLAYATDPTDTWTTLTSGFSTSYIAAVGYGNGYWVIGGQNGKMATSPIVV